MKFPQISSVDINQLPTDASELTPQEEYIFETVFEPEVKMFNEQYSKNFQQPINQPYNNQVAISQNSGKSNNKEGEKKHGLVRRVLISLSLTALIVLYSLSPMPNIVKYKFGSFYTIIFVVLLLLFSFFTLSKFIK